MSRKSQGKSKAGKKSVFKVNQSIQGKTSARMAFGGAKKSAPSRPSRKFKGASEESSASRKGKWMAEGLVKRHPDGFGFFIPDDPEAPDVYIPRHEMAGVMTNDRARVFIAPEGRGDRYRGEVIEILDHSMKRASGHYDPVKAGVGLLRDRSLAWGADLIVKNPKALPVEDGDFVVAEILTYPNSPEGFTGQLIAIIGDVENPLNDSLRALHRHHIPFEFSPQTLKEAEKVSAKVLDHERQGRRDLTQVALITIDGRTAKDFDDAIFVDKNPAGFRLIVAIADVSHYVRPQTFIDDDAYQRGTSTYFPSFVAPMLPEALSNEICSLKPKVDRLAFVADMVVDHSGDLVSSDFYEAVIRSHARVTYGEAQEIIDGQKVKGLEHVENEIKRAGDLAKILMSRRFEAGSLDLDIPETEVELDDTGEPVDIIQSERLFAHRLIEEMMLMANVAVARRLRQANVTRLNRVHEAPPADAIAALSAFMETLGSHRSLSGGGLQKKITKALEDFRGHPQQHILNVLTLRSMAQAKYSVEDFGHFGLGFQDYVHFTSPIRRYPDLIIHRQLKAVLGIRGYRVLPEEDLVSAGTFLSACEQRSVKAERFIKAIKKARFMARRLGEEYEGMVSSVTKFGVFVILRQFDVDGLIKLEDLPGDRYEFDQEQMMLIGRRSGSKIQVGDLMKVVVSAANIDEGRVDFLPAGKGGHRARAVGKK